MKKRIPWLLFGLGVLMGLVGVGAVLFVRLAAPGILLPPGETGVVYLSPLNAPELWRNSPDGQNPKRLSETGGQVFDFAVSPEGREIVFSAGNVLKGFDLWLLPSAGGQPRRLLDCGADQCSGAAFAPDGLRIAYSRRIKAENPGGNTPGLGRIWILTLKDGTTSPVYGDAAVGGLDALWSPDGVHLALYDPLAGAIRIHDLEGGQDMVLPVMLEKSGGWTNDGKKLVFADYAQGQERPIGALSELDLATGKVSPAFAGLELVDFGNPVFNPAGSWIAVGGQLEGEGTARSIWVVSLDGSQKQRLSNDPQASQGAYHWDPDGKRLVYQEYRLGDPGHAPAVYVWDLQSRTAQLVAENAALPAWVR